MGAVIELVWGVLFLAGCVYAVVSIVWCIITGKGRELWNW